MKKEILLLMKAILVLVVLLTHQNLAFCNSDSVAKPLSPELQLQKLQQLAEQGDAVEQNNLGSIHLNSNNFKEAIEWFTRASEQDLPEAYLNLGLMHLRGLGVDQNIDFATSYFEKASQHRLPLSFFFLGITYQSKTDEETALRHFEKGCELGEKKSCAWLLIEDKQISQGVAILNEECEKGDVWACKIKPHFEVLLKKSDKSRQANKEIYNDQRMVVYTIAAILGAVVVIAAIVGLFRKSRTRGG